MATSTELAQHQVVTRDGIVTATLLDRVAVDRIYLMLVRGAAAAQFGRTLDQTALVDRTVKDLIIFPRPT